MNQENMQKSALKNTRKDVQDEVCKGMCDMTDASGEVDPLEKEISCHDMISSFLGTLMPCRGRVVTCILIGCLFFLITLILCSLFGWEFYQQCPRDSWGGAQKQFADRITANRIRLLYEQEDGRLSPVSPSWIHEDIPSQIVNSSAVQSNLSIYDDEQISALCNAVKEIYWIKKIKRMRKFYPAFLEIEVEYRKPTVLVIVPDLPDSEDPEAHRLQYIPLSQDCIILPTSPDLFPVTAEDRDDFPTFCGVVPVAFNQTDRKFERHEFDGFPRPISETPGTWWFGKEVLVDVITIVSELGERWKRFDLDYICVEEGRDGNDYTFTAEFCLVTKKGSRIHWGKCNTEYNAQNRNMVPDEALDSDKIEQLDRMYNEKHGIFFSNNIFNISFRRQSQVEKQQAMNHLPDTQQTATEMPASETGAIQSETQSTQFETTY